MVAMLLPCLNALNRVALPGVWRRCARRALRLCRGCDLCCSPFCRSSVLALACSFLVRGAACSAWLRAAHSLNAWQQLRRQAALLLHQAHSSACMLAG